MLLNIHRILQITVTHAQLVCSLAFFFRITWGGTGPCKKIFRITTASSSRGWLEFDIPFQHKYGYIRDESSSTDTVPITQPRIWKLWRGLNVLVPIRRKSPMDLILSWSSNRLPRKWMLHLSMPVSISKDTSKQLVDNSRYAELDDN